MIYYFAYGSNLHPLRLTERVRSAEFICVAKIRNHSLRFHKKSKDGSSKCNLLQTSKDTDLVYGAIFKLDASEKGKLDKIEGKGYGYIDNQILLSCNNTEYNCFTYLAKQSHILDNLKPYHWYKTLVVLGAKYLQFPDLYINFIESVESIEDPDKERRSEMDILIEKLTNYR